MTDVCLTGSGEGHPARRTKHFSHMKREGRRAEGAVWSCTEKRAHKTSRANILLHSTGSWPVMRLSLKSLIKHSSAELPMF